MSTDGYGFQRQYKRLSDHPRKAEPNVTDSDPHTPETEAERHDAAELLRTQLSCRFCHHIIPQDLRGPGVLFCGPVCDATYAGSSDTPGTLNYFPQTPHERTANRKALRSKNY